ncbi:MAG: molecular chaperone HtpG [Tissierellia bacterium]|nr:molecular chaperone HtpG [Tissierellia bacterium]
MTKREFQAESKRLMELMIHSIYSNKDIFIRELLSNSSDALDKAYYLSLEDSTIPFNRNDYYIKVIPNKEQRTITILDTGIGMNAQELEDHLGIIAKSGNNEFKTALKQKKRPSEIIGEFGVGFYSSFMVAKKVSVHSRKLGEEIGHIWISQGPDGYEVHEKKRDLPGTTITLHLMEDTENEKFSRYLELPLLKQLIVHFSNYLRYPIYLPEIGKEDSWEQVNSMVPLWKKNKLKLTEEDYENFYVEQQYGYDKPLDYIHIFVEGLISYRGILFIPSKPPIDYYSKDYKKGLQLYSNGVMILDSVEELLPDYFGFIKGVIDSEDFSLNISREMLQQNQELKTIAKNIETKIIQHLLKMQKCHRSKYETFYQAFGPSIKMGIYESFGGKKHKLADLLLFKTSNQDGCVSLKEYVERMKKDQDFIYYATGHDVEQIEKLPQGTFVKKKGYEFLYLTDPIDEFILKAMESYDTYPFKNISQELPEREEEDQVETTLFQKMKAFLPHEVVEVRGSSYLEDDPVCIRSRGDISIEMERTFLTQPGTENIIAQKILEINKNHPIYQTLISFTEDEGMLEKYTNLLYTQARLIEGLPIADPVNHTRNIINLLLK